LYILIYCVHTITIYSYINLNLKNNICINGNFYRQVSQGNPFGQIEKIKILNLFRLILGIRLRSNKIMRYFLRYNQTPE